MTTPISNFPQPIVSAPLFRGPRLGRKKASDPRDLRYLATMHVKGVGHGEPDFADLPVLTRMHVQGPQLDQGDTSRCTVFALAQLILSGPIMQSLPGEPTNPFHKVALTEDHDVIDPYLTEMYRYAQENDEWPGAEPEYYGTSGRAAAQAFRRKGYLDNFYWLTTVEEIARFIILHGPVPVGTDWFSGMDQKDDRGFLLPTGSWRGGHEYLLDGVSIGRRYFRMRQSWGYSAYTQAFISFEAMAYLLRTGGDALAIPEIRIPKVA